MLGKRWQPLTRVCKVRREKSGCDNNSKLIASLFVIPPMYAGAWSRIRCTLYVSFPIASPRCLSNGRTSSIVCPCFGKLTSGGGSHRPLPPARPCYEKCPVRGLTLGAFSALTTMKRITALFWASPILSEMANYATNRSPNQSQKRLN